MNPPHAPAAPALFRRACKDTIPVFTGYLFLGFGFGLILRAAGYPVVLAPIMGLSILAGSMQYAAVGLMTGGASLLTAALTTVFINARYLFYGISMLEPYRNAGRRKPYLIFTLTDETYALVCREHEDLSPEQLLDYRFLVSLLDHIYWILGCTLGAVTGSLVHFNSAGIDFVLTALFLTMFTQQWLDEKKHGPALIGVLASVVCLVLFGSETFLIPAMLAIACILCFYPEAKEHA